MRPLAGLFLVAMFAATAGCQDSGVVVGEDDGIAPASSEPVSAAPSSSSSTTSPPVESTVDESSVASRCSPDSDSSHTISVWHSLGSDSALKLIELTDRFNELDTGVTVSLESPGNYEQTVAALAASPPESMPDVVLVDHKSTRAFADSGEFVPPRECGAPGELLSDLLPVVEATYTLDGELLAVPYNVSTPVLMFDETILEQAGLDPGIPPRTLEELSDASEAVVGSGAAAYGFVAYDGYGPWFITQYNSRLGQVSGLPGNGRDGSPVTSVDFDTPEARESFGWLFDEVANGHALWIGGNPSGFDDLVRLSDRETGAAFTISTSGAIGDLLRLIEAGSSPGSVLGVAPMPGPGHGALVGGGAFWLLDSGDAERVGAASSFVEWLAAAAQHAEFAGHTGFSPIRTGELDEPALSAAWAANPVLRVSFDQLAGLPADDVRAGPVWGAGTEINRVMYETTTYVIESGDVSGSLDDATDEVNMLLDVYQAEMTPD